MSKSIRFGFVLMSGALMMTACGADRPEIPPVAPVVQPMPQEGLFGEEAASDSSGEDSLDSSKADESKTSDKSKPAEKTDAKPASSDSEPASADKAAEASANKAEPGKPKPAPHTKYKHKSP